MNAFQLKSRFRRLLGQQQDANRLLIEQKGAFDPVFYRQQYPDCGSDPLAHYMTVGSREGASPLRYFDTAYYARQNPDVTAAGILPLVHYLQDGWKEGRHPSGEFDLIRYRDVHMAGDKSHDPLLHYSAHGRRRQLEVFPVQDPIADEIRASGTFDAEFYLSRYPDVAEVGLEPLRHFIDHGAAEHRWPNAWFDPEYYLRHNPEVALRFNNPLLHFIEQGWKDLRNPSSRFDVWWYWASYLDPASTDINPLGHFLCTGQFEGLLPKPALDIPQVPGRGCSYPQGQTPRRVCLFAGYDVHGLVDDYVVDYVRELSRHADVYYLADCQLQEGELEKLRPWVKQAWAQRHGEYDMGSYARLARDLVGWETIDRYDELLLVNDSCYLLKPLEEIFRDMDGRPCDWWGLQATKGIAATRRKANNQFQQPIPMDTVRQTLLPAFENDYTYDFLVGSYFLAFRRPVLDGNVLRRQLGAVTAQPDKAHIIQKYEIGLTRLLLAAGYQLETYIRHLYPFHPIFTEWYFRLLDKGFPLLKRYLLSNNHYHIPHLVDWPERVRRKVPDANVALIDANLRRVTDPEQLERVLNLGTARVVEDAPQHERLLTDTEFHAADLLAPKYPDWWGFPACAFTGTFSGNERAVFEQVKHDPSIRKIIFTRSREVSVEGNNVDVVPLESPQGQYLLMRCGPIFIKHSPTRNLIYPLAHQLHNTINLWHGIPYKRIGFASLDMHARLDAIAEEHAQCKAVIASSRVDAMAMASAFYPLSYHDVWVTGLPRNDFILRARDQLPNDMQAQLDALERMLAGRRLLLYMPTFRNGQEGSHYHYSEQQLQWLGRWLQQHDAVLGLREHMADTSRSYAQQFAVLDPLDLSDEMFPNVELLYRASSALITDYSSTFIDYMLTGKPAISFAYDLASYQALERGTFYDLEKIFPGPVCRDFEQLSMALEKLFDEEDAVGAAAMQWKRDLFFDYVDDNNAARVIARVREQSDLGRVGKQWKYGEIT